MKTPKNPFNPWGCTTYALKNWLPDKVSNLEPADPESAALPIELSGNKAIIPAEKRLGKSASLELATRKKQRKIGQCRTIRTKSDRSAPNKSGIYLSLYNSGPTGLSLIPANLSC